MTTNPPQLPQKLSKRIVASLIARHETTQWETLIGSLLRRLELQKSARQAAEKAYELLGDAIAKKLALPRHDVEVFPQGSMRTQTTISQRHPVKFDLDIVVKLSGPRYLNPDPEQFFKDFGKALEGNESTTGVPTPKRRCWRLDYPGEPFYFDVTPAIDDSACITGAALRVRDPDIRWAPSNPEEFACWFCDKADKRFYFQVVSKGERLFAADSVTPLPSEPIGLDDILRRTVQLMKLHRDTMYWFADEKHKENQPISIIIVTLATHAYNDLYLNHQHEFSSPIEVVLALVEAMPDYIERRSNGNHWVANPKLAGENFADKWNSDDGARHAEFKRWHKALEDDLEALLHQDEETATVDRIRSVFGEAGVAAWQQSKPKADVMSGLISSAAGHVRSNPSAPLRSGSHNSLG